MKNYHLLIILTGFLLFTPAFLIAQSESETLTQDKTDTADTTDTVLKSDSLELYVEGVYESESGAIVRLAEKDGNGKWCMIMVIGDCEAIAMTRTMNDATYSRPMTYDILNSLFTETTLILRYVLITKLEGGTYYAEIVLDDNGKKIVLDARPSDSINMALKAGVPIYASNEVWAEAKEKM